LNTIVVIKIATNVKIKLDNIAIVWFRNDLRIHDNEGLTEALLKADKILPVYVFDEKVFRGKTSLGFEKTGKFRTKFIIESVQNLRENLRSKGSDLVIRIGDPAEEIFLLAKELKTSWVYCNRERTAEEIKVQDDLEKKLWSVGQELRFCRGKMLYYTADLPFPISQVPDVFTTFRKEIEHIVPLRKPLPEPTKIPFPIECTNRGEVPTLKCFDNKEVEEDQHIENQKFKGGESEGLKQLHKYFWETNNVQHYKETRDELLGWDFSTKLSPWLSAGCISPKLVVQQRLKYEAEVKKNDSTYWVYFELLWRDFFRLMGKKYENRIFKYEGIRQKDSGGTLDMDLFELWAKGNTGVPFIDANMRQLNATGFMSNRGRQNVASFLVKDLKLNWLLGAEYFESLLIDYDPCSNYGNWNYLAGIGSDPREDRYFNILTQAKKYDANGDFVKYWVKELSQVPSNLIHIPDQMSMDEQKRYGVMIGQSYPSAIFSFEKSY